MPLNTPNDTFNIPGSEQLRGAADVLQQVAEHSEQQGLERFVFTSPAVAQVTHGEMKALATDAYNTAAAAETQYISFQQAKPIVEGAGSWLQYNRGHAEDYGLAG